MGFTFSESFPGVLGTLAVAPGTPPGPGGSGGAASPAPGVGWEIYVRSWRDYTTLLAVIPYKTWTGFQFAKQLNDIGSGSVTLNADDPFWKGGWSLAATGSPLTADYFIAAAAAVANISAGDTFTWSGQPATTFTVTAISAPFAGFVNVSFSPPVGSTVTSGTVTSLNKTMLPDGAAPFELLDYECLWQFYQDGVCRMEFLGETITEQLVDPSEQRIITVTGPGSIATLKWGMAAPQGFPHIVLKLDSIIDPFDEVDINGNPVLDTNVWNVVSPAGCAFPTPIATIYNYPAGAGYPLSQLYPSGTLTVNATPGTSVCATTPYDATDTLVSAQVTPVGASGAQADSNGNPVRYGTGLNGSELTQFYIESLKDPSKYAMFGLSSGTFYCQAVTTSGTFTKVLPAYDSSNHAYWMITEQGGSGGGNGTFYFWTSGDGQNWVKQWTIVHDWDATYCGFYLAATYSITGQSMTITNLNSMVTTPSYQGNLYLGEPMMGIWYDLLLACQARGTIPFVTTAAGPGLDSFGRPWADVQNVQVTNGTDLYTLLQNACAAVNADFCMQPGFLLQVGLTEQGAISLGTDRSSQIILREGRDFLTKTRTRTRSQLQNLIGAENTDGHEISASNLSSASQWGQREGWFQTSAQVDPQSLAIASAAAVADTALEVLSYTGTIPPGTPGKTIFQNYDVGDWLGLERPDFSAVDAVRVVAIAVSVDATGLESDELTFSSYMQWLEAQLQYVANKLGGQFVNIPGTSPVAPSRYGTGQVPTWFTPAQTLAGLADVVGSGGSHSAPLVYNPATGQWQAGGSADPVTGAAMGISLVGAAIAPDGGGAAVAAASSVKVIPGQGVTVTNAATGATVSTGVQSDGTTTTVVAGAPPPLTPDAPTVVGGPGTVSVGWDGLLGGAGPLSDFAFVQVHVSTTSGFTPSTATMQGTIHLGGGIFTVSRLTAGTTYYAKLVAVNQAGAVSVASTQNSAVPIGTGTTATISATAPVSPQTGDLWLKQWSGTAWTPFQYGTNAISAGAITAAQIAANTITAAQIASGTITATQIAASTITAGQLAAGIVYAGIVNGTTIMGATVVADGTSGEVLVYSGAPASGNLIGSWSGAAGTDGQGNPYPLGLMAQALVMPNQSSGPAAVSGASSLYSSVAGRLFYLSSAGVTAALERSTVNVASFTVGATATPTIISAPLAYQANEGAQSSEFEIEIDGLITTANTGQTSQTLTFQLDVDGSVLGGQFTVGAVFLPVGNKTFSYTIRFRLSIQTTGTSGTCSVAADGQLAAAGVNAGSTTAPVPTIAVGAQSGASKPFNSTVSHTLQAYASWGGSSSGETLQTVRTKVARRM
jgi:hypothetical protein